MSLQTKRKKVQLLIIIVITFILLIVNNLDTFAAPNNDNGATIVREETLNLNGSEVAYIAVGGEVKSVNPVITSVADSLEGWSWNHTTKTLSLFGADIKAGFDSGDTFGLILPINSTVYLEEGTVNNIVAGKTYGSSYGIYGYNNLTIEGPGSLNVGSGEANTNSYGIFVEKTLTFDSKVNVFSQSASRSVAIFNDNNDVALLENADVTANGGTASSVSAGIWAYKIYSYAQSNLIAKSTFSRDTSIGIITSYFTAYDNSKVTAIGGKADKYSHGLQVYYPTINQNALVVLKSDTSASVKDWAMNKITAGTLELYLIAGWPTYPFAVYGSGYNVLEPSTSSYGYLFNAGTENFNEPGMTYDAATRTLTLTNCIINPSDSLAVKGLYIDFGLSTNYDFTINLVGTNIITAYEATTSGQKRAGIYTTAELNINGPGELIVVAPNSDDANSAGIYSDNTNFVRDININNAQVTTIGGYSGASSSSYGIFSRTGELNINSSVVYASGSFGYQGAWGMFSSQEMNIDQSEVQTISGVANSYNAYGMMSEVNAVDINESKIFSLGLRGSSSGSAYGIFSYSPFTFQESNVTAISGYARMFSTAIHTQNIGTANISNCDINAIGGYGDMYNPTSKSIGLFMNYSNLVLDNSEIDMATGYAASYSTVFERYSSNQVVSMGNTAIVDPVNGAFNGKHIEDKDNEKAVCATISYPSYNVTFINNEAVESGRVPDSLKGVENCPIIVPGNINQLVRENYVLIGWESDYDHLTYEEDDYYGMPSQNVIFTSVWEPGYRIYYNANQGLTAPEDLDYYINGETINIDFTNPVRPGYLFLGWSKDSQATSASYVLGGIETILMGEESIILYAVWEAVDRSLTDLSITNLSESMAPVFSSPNYGYSASVAIDTQTVALSYTQADPVNTEVIVKINGEILVDLDHIAVPGGENTIEVIIRDEAGNQTTYNVAISREVTTGISAAPSIDFGTEKRGYHAPGNQTVTISNTGNRTITLNQPLSDIYENGVLSSTTLRENETATFTVGLPEGLGGGIYDETVEITGNYLCETSITVSFTVEEEALSGTALINQMTPAYGDLLTGQLVGSNNTGVLTYTWKVDDEVVLSTTSDMYQVQASDVGKVITLEITSNHEYGVITSNPTTAVDKKTVLTPNIPVLESKTHNVITVEATEGYEYSLDGVIWQISNCFTGLTPETSYEIYQRVAEKSYAYASVSSEKLIVVTDVEPIIPLTGIADIDVKNPVVFDKLTGRLLDTNNTGDLTYTWKANGNVVGSGQVYYVTVSDIGKVLTLEVTSSEESGTCLSDSTDPVIKATFDAPDAPIVLSRTHTTITLKSEAFMEYSKDGINWQGSQVFADLAPITAYTFYQRYKASESTFASESSQGCETSTRTIPQHSKVTNLTWDDTVQGKATWLDINDSTNETGYKIQLKKNGESVGVAIYLEHDTETYDFTEIIADNGTGIYTFVVYAIGDGYNFTNGPKIEVSVGYIYGSSHQIEGTVTDEDGVPLAGADVRVMKGNIQINQTVTTDAVGQFLVPNVPYGKYNLVITKGNDRKVVLFIEVLNTDYAAGVIILPTGIKNTVLDVASEAPDVVVDHMNTLFDQPDIYKESDSNLVNEGGIIEMKLIVDEEQPNSSFFAIQSILEDLEFDQVLMMGLRLVKTAIDSTDHVLYSVGIQDAKALLKIVIPIPEDKQNGKDYSVVRSHDYGSGEVIEFITTTPNAYGEKIVVSSNKEDLTLYCRFFSEYALAYRSLKETSNSGDSNSNESTSTSGDISNNINGSVDRIVAYANEDTQIQGTWNIFTTEYNRNGIIIQLDNNSLKSSLYVEGLDPVITIPYKDITDTVTVQLNGEQIKEMEDYEAVLRIEVLDTIYTIPVKALNIEALHADFGSNVRLSQLIWNITVEKAESNMIDAFENELKTEDLKVIRQPITYNIIVEYNGEIIALNHFPMFIEKAFKLPVEVDFSSTLTGIAINQDGNIRHIPTRIEPMDDGYYAVLSSFDNHTLAVISNEVYFDYLDGHWSAETFNNMASRLIINENLEHIPNHTYTIESTVNRYEMVVFLVKALGVEPRVGESIFDDVYNNDWYSPYINAAADYGWIHGYTNGDFGPHDEITREQAITMIANIIKSMRFDIDISLEELSKFEDVMKISDYALENSAILVNAGIIEGVGENKIAPQSRITVQEVVTILERMLQIMEIID